MMLTFCIKYPVGVRSLERCVAESIDDGRKQGPISTRSAILATMRDRLDHDAPWALSDEDDWTKVQLLAARRIVRKAFPEMYDPPKD